jgi:hypothetical protein
MTEQLLIDRIEAVGLFRALLDKKKSARIMRLTGTEKMGKSRMLREYRHIAEQEYHAHCALVDLRSKLLSHSDLLHVISQQVGPLPIYGQTRNELSQKPKLDVRGITQILSTMMIGPASDADTNNHQRDRLTTALMDDFRALPQNAVIVLMFDAFEEAPVETQSWINEHLILGLSRLANAHVVLAGRQLPEPIATWQHLAVAYNLPPVELNNHRDFCSQIGVAADDAIIKALHLAVDGRPGLFSELATQLKNSHES